MAQLFESLVTCPEKLLLFDRHVNHSRVWRDTLVAYFFEVCTILDERRERTQVRFEHVPALLAGVPSRVRRGSR